MYLQEFVQQVGLFVRGGLFPVYLKGTDSFWVLSKPHGLDRV